MLTRSSLLSFEVKGLLGKSWHLVYAYLGGGATVFVLRSPIAFPFKIPTLAEAIGVAGLGRARLSFQWQVAVQKSG